MPNAKRVFFAPRESEAHKILLREAAKTGAIAPVLRELLCVMNADPDLIAFPTACQHLEEIITAIKQTWKADPATWGLDRYDATLQWVQSTRMSLRSPKNIGEKYDPENITLNPMFGNGMDRHPLYTLLLSTHANSEDHSQSRYRLVQAHVLVGIIAALQLQYPSQSEQDLLVDAYEAHGTPEEWKPLSNSIRDVCLSARRLALAEKPYYTYFQDLPVELPPKEFASKFLESTALSSVAVRNRWLAIRHHHLRIFMRKVVGELPFSARPELDDVTRHMGEILREKTEIGVGLARRLLTLGDPDDPYIGGSSPTALAVCKRRNADEIRRALDADDDPFTDDGSDNDTYDTSRSKRGPRGRQVPGWYQLQPIVMHNQLLPLSFANLAPAEAREFVSNAQLWLSEHSADRMKGGQVGELKLKILQLTMLATGCSLERAHRLVVFPHSAHEKSVDLSLRLQDDPSKTATWRIAVINLPYIHHPEVEPITQRRQSDFVLLPDILGVSRFIEVLLKQTSKRAGSSTLSPRAIFGKDVRKFSTFLKKTLSEEDPEGRLTVSKLSGFLFSRMMWETGGDVTASAIATGQTVTLARTRLFYACVRLLRIQKAYSNVFRPIIGYPEQTVRSIDFADEDIWVSTRPCPTRKAVEDLVGQLLKDLAKIEPYSGIESYALYHRLYTLYTFLFQAYCLGTRAISSPILIPSQIDEDGFVWTDDKDTGNHYNAHLALCTKHLIIQLGYYAEHLNEVRQHMTWRMGPQSRYQTILSQSCFFLHVSNGHLKPEEVSRGTIEAILFDYLSFPVNVHRRFVAGELLDSGVSPEIIDWWASHWNAGEEPWNKASSLSPEAYRAGIEQPISTLLGILGFKPKTTTL